MNPGVKEDCATVGVDDNCDGKTDEGCLNAAGCGADGLVCGGGKGACSSGHCFWTDDKGYKWTLVPAGTFWMGCNSVADDGCEGNETPQHLIDMSAYWIGVYEVTVSEYKACVDAGGVGCSMPGTGNFANWGVVGKEQHPVNYVNWLQSEGYCKWLSGDLPTEAQWEKAARGGCEIYAGKCSAAEPKYPWGNTAPTCGQEAVFFAGGVGCNKKSTFAVGAGSAKGQSPYGLYDIAGNVREWNLDWYDAGFYGKGSAKEKDAWNSLAGSHRVIRGGWAGNLVSISSDLRSGFRSYDAPAISVYHTGETGVRCAKPFP